MPASDAVVLIEICVHVKLYSSCGYKDGFPVTQRTLGIVQTCLCSQKQFGWSPLIFRMCNSTHIYTRAAVLKLCINQYMSTATSDIPTKPKGCMQGCPLRASLQVLPT